jgi:hypothetical protein
MKTLALLATIISCVILLPEDIPTPTPYESPGNATQRVQEFIRGDRDTLDESDLYSPTVPEPLRNAAKNLIN